MSLATIEISDHALWRFGVRFAKAFDAPPLQPGETLRGLLRRATPAARARSLLALMRYQQPAAYFISDGWGIVTDEACTTLFTIYRLGESRDRWVPIPRAPRRRARRRRR